MDAELAELATEARVLDAAEREARVGCDHAVDEQQSGLDLGDKPVALRILSGPRGSAELEVGSVGNPDRVANVAGLEHRRDRAEQLVTGGRRSRRNIGENSRLIEETLAIDLLSAGQNARARGDWLPALDIE